MMECKLDFLNWNFILHYLSIVILLLFGILEKFSFHFTLFQCSSKQTGTKMVAADVINQWDKRKEQLNICMFRSETAVDHSVCVKSFSLTLK
mmetsp:Transcript_20753/g.27323  ORF Transcript_20753/g.27323 Transcript_20753/m.27323 type:complete len:92 (-) Transcript_20753:218-493(-)